MKIAVSGKGGVGKTTVSSLIARHFARNGYKVLAVDADPDANLGASLGFTNTEEIVPIAHMKELIFERTGAKPGSIGSFFKMNPKVEDIPEAVWRENEGVRLMVLGTVEKGGAGCICPESILLKNLVNHILLLRKEVVLLDMEAGIEHLGRATSKAVNMLIVVVEPGRRSVDTAKKIRELATDLGVERIAIIGNKVRSEADEEFLKKNLSDFEILGFLPFNENIIRADQENLPPDEIAPELKDVIKDIVDSNLVVE